MAFPLSLQARAATADADLPLGELVRRINEEREHFRNITEDGLRKEIEDLTDVADVEEQEGDEGAKILDFEGRRKELYAARADMLKFVG